MKIRTSPAAQTGGRGKKKGTHTTQASYGRARTVIRLTGFINSALYQSLNADQITSVKFGAAEASGRPAQFIHLYPLTSNTTWTETTVTWNNVGSYSTALDCGDYLTDSQFTKFDITELVKGWKNNYNLLASGSNRATIFLGHIPYSTVANMIFARFGLYLSEAENLEALQTQQPDTYNFLRSLDDELTEIEDYT